MIARNLIPVVGIYGFGLFAAVAVFFNYWFDRFTTLIAIGAVLIPRALRETQPKSVGAISAAANLVRNVVAWIFPRRHRRSAVMDCADFASRSAAWQRTALRARAFAGTVVHFRRARCCFWGFIAAVPI